MTVRLLRWEKPPLGDEQWFTGKERLHSIAFSDFLAAGKAPKFYPPGGQPIDIFKTYKRDELRVGDHIEYCSRIIDGNEECLFFGIIRRPGGKIPQAPEERDLNLKLSFSERMQVYQDFEEKGIPIATKWQPLASAINAPGPNKAVPCETEVKERYDKVKAILDKANDPPPAGPNKAEITTTSKKMP